MPPDESLYERKFRTPICWSKIGERNLIGVEMVQQTDDKFKIIKYRLNISLDRKRLYSDL